MQLLRQTSRLALIAANAGRSRAFSAIPTTASRLFNADNVASVQASSRPRFDTSTRAFMSSDKGEQEQQQTMLRNIGREQMEEIVEDYENGGRADSGYVVLDVREENEVAYTGKLSPNTLTFPLQKLMRLNAFALDEDDFEDEFGFEKPSPDETLVFSCAAGIRSVHAAQFASQAGYSQLVNYQGGANQWFSPF
jgi:rhodanese-related sulfurtransferase